MDMTTPVDSAPPQRQITRRTIVALCILVATAAGSAHVAFKAHQYNAFTRQAFQVMNSFTAAKAADQPLDRFAPAFAELNRSDRAIGKMLTIAYIERTGTLRDRDQAIIDAANDLDGKDLYKLLSAAAPMFRSSAREAYIEGRTPGLGFPGVDMRVDTLTSDQRRAMNGCLRRLEPTYSKGGFEGRIKVATSLYAGAHWEKCSIPVRSTYPAGTAPFGQAI